MPEISRFYGIVIRLFYGDHLPPHFHVTYGSHNAKFNIIDLNWMECKLPPRAQAMVEEWAKLHQAELQRAFATAASLQQPAKIDPLP
ncbi:MAG: DUF4160 domain-containing protein [Verrucomicrobia bacterium]|nr:DUF4160 domain-containing protein [Verrucomicrobiota bacterium]